MSIAGHVSRAILSRCSHVRMEAKRRAPDEIAARQRAADEKRKAEAERQQAAAVVTQSAVVLKPPPSTKEWRASVWGQCTITTSRE